MPEIVQQFAKRTVAATQSETFTVPAGSGTYTAQLQERPQQETPSTVSAIEGVTVYSEVATAPVAVTEFAVDYWRGEIIFLKNGTARTVVVEYEGTGSVARAEWANQQTTWQARSYFLIGQPRDASNVAVEPNGTILFPSTITSGVTAKRYAANAQTVHGVTGQTYLVCSNYKDYTDSNASYVVLVLGTSGYSLYYNYSTADIPLYTANGAPLFIRATQIGGHANIWMDIFAI